MTVTVVKGLLQPLATEQSRSAYANSQNNQSQVQASKNAASAVAQSSDAVVTSLRSSSIGAVDRPSKGKPIESEKEARAVAESIAADIKADKNGEGLGVHKLSGNAEKSLS